MPANAQLATSGIIGLIADSGPVAKFVLLLLAGASVYCWAIIITKWKTIKRATNENTEFLNIFWHGKNLDEVLAKCDKFASSPVASIFKSGVKELRKNSPEENSRRRNRRQRPSRADPQLRPGSRVISKNTSAGSRPPQVLHRSSACSVRSGES